MTSDRQPIKVVWDEDGCFMRYAAVYLDHLSSAPPPAEAVDVLSRYWVDRFGLPGALHQWGQWSKATVEASSERVCELLGAAGGKCAFAMGPILPQARGVVLVSPIEWGAVRDALGSSGAAVEVFPMSGWTYDLAWVEKRLQRGDIGLVVASAADRTTGTIQPVRELSQLCRSHGVPLYCDVSALVGRMPFSLAELGADFAFVEGKLFGALCDATVGIEASIHLPAPLAASFAKALESALANIEERSSDLARLTQYFWELLGLHLPHIVLLGGESRVAGVLTVAFEDVDRGAIALALDMQGVAVWAGKPFAETIPQLEAMGVEKRLIDSAVRFALWHTNTQEEIDYVLRVLPPLVDRVRYEKGSPKFRG